MNIIYRGKIGRLPAHLREQLNQRLADGETGETLLEWLNALPTVQAMLHRQFDGHPIRQQNLSNWHLGGYQHWLQQQERRQLIRQLAHDALAGVMELTPHGATRLTMDPRPATVPPPAGDQPNQQETSLNSQETRLNSQETKLNQPLRT